MSKSNRRHHNGAAALPQNGGLAPQQQPQQVQVNPIEAAQAALMFLSRADHKVAERERFDLAAAMLNAIALGQVVLAPAPQQKPVPVPANEPAAAPTPAVS